MMMEQPTKDVQSPTESRAKHHQSTSVLDANYLIVTTSSVSNTTIFILINYDCIHEIIFHVRLLTWEIFSSPPLEKVNLAIT